MTQHLAIQHNLAQDYAVRFSQLFQMRGINSKKNGNKTNSMNKKISIFLLFKAATISDL